MNYMGKFRLDGKTALVCGGLGLIGKEISVALAEAGAKVLVLDIDKKRFERCKDFYYGLDIEFIDFDVGSIASYKRKISNILRDHGPIHILVNAAYPKTKDWTTEFKKIRAKSWRKNVEMQLDSVCLLTKEVAESMIKNKVDMTKTKGSIINIGSTYGVVGPDFRIYKGTNLTCPAAYSAIKGGIINFTRYAASYYGKYGIRINCLCPGGIFNNQPNKFIYEYIKRTPLGRMGKPDEIASATLFLASDASSYMTGAIMMVDGGWTCI